MKYAWTPEGGNMTDFEYSGAQYGVRLGVQHLGLMGGLAYTRSAYTLKITPLFQAKGEDKQKQDEFGVFVGYNFPILFRAWLGHFFSVKQSQTENGTYGTSADWNKGSATEIGIGFSGLPFISLNLSYRMLSFDKGYNPTDGEGPIRPNYKPKEIVLGISLPLTL